MIFRGQLRVPVPPFSEGGPNQWGGPNLSIAAPPSMLSDRTDLLTWLRPAKIIVASAKMLDAVQ